MPVPPGGVPGYPGLGSSPGQGRSGQDGLNDLGASGLISLERAALGAAHQLHPRRLAPPAHRPTPVPQNPPHRRGRLTSHHPRHRITTHILTNPSTRHKTPLHEWCIHHQTPPWSGWHPAAQNVLAGASVGGHWGYGLEGDGEDGGPAVEGVGDVEGAAEGLDALLGLEETELG